MLSITSNALRQQIVNIEVRRLEREIKDILDEYAQDEPLKKQLLKGKRVDLAEELSKEIFSFWLIKWILFYFCNVIFWFRTRPVDSRETGRVYSRVEWERKVDKKLTTW